MCKFDGCDGRVQARGMCAAHYKRWQLGWRDGRLSSPINRANRGARVKDLNAWLVEGMKKGPCMDCRGQFEPCQMDFDHRYDKVAQVSGNFVRGPTKRMVEEVNKCDLVCANCHRLRTYI